MPSRERITMRKSPPGRESISHDVILKPLGPAQHAIRSGSAQALNTRSRGALKTRVMSNSRSRDSLAAALLLTAISLLLGLQLAQIVLQPIEAFLPEAAIVDRKSVV